MAPIIVTGSAIPTTDTEGASPVAVIDSDTIEKRGYQTVEDVLKTLPANGSSSSAGQVANAFAAGGAYVSLRGLGPQATLVLINGRRVTDYAAPANGQYAFVDVNNIPAEIVDRVEVLTEGTALYGADAVAGVVNIITKKDLGSENGEVDAYVGNTYHKDALDQRYTVMGSLNSFDKNGFGMVEVDYQHQNSILAQDLPISDDADQSTHGGFNLRSSRTYPGQFSVDGGTTLFSLQPGVGNVPLTGITNGTDPNVLDGAPTSYNYNPPTSIVPETERYGTYLTYTYKFYDGNIVPNLDFDYRHNRTIFQEAAAPWSLGDGIAPEISPRTGEATFIVPGVGAAANPYNQTGQDIDIIKYRFVGLGNRGEDVDNDVFRAVPSVDFKLGDGWTLNAGFNYNYTFLDDRNIGYPSATVFQNELNSTNPATAYNPFTSAGNQAPGVLQKLLVSTGNRDTASLLGEDFRLNGKLFDLPGGPVQIAFGGQYQLERYNQSYTGPDLAGDVIGSSTQLDTAASRKVLSGYTELDIPLTSPSFNIPGFYSVDVLAAARVDKYSTFGSTANPQIRLRWETIPGLVIRGGYSKSFRAPSLPELFAGGNQSVQSVFDPVAIDPTTGQAGVFRDITVNGGGNPKLKPETAETFSAGVAYSPSFVKGLLVTADFFKIRYTNQILQQDPQTLVDEGSSQVLHNSDGTIASITASYANETFSYIQGIDAGVSYVWGDPAGDYGQYTFGLNSTYYLNYKTDDGTGISENIGEDSGGLGPYSRYRHDINVTWDYRNFSFTVSNDFTSGYTDTSVEEFGIFRNVDSYLIFNLQASYTFDKQDIDKWIPGPHEGGFDWGGIVSGTRISIGVNNVWDVQPPFTANPSNTLGYDQTYADGTGRFLFAEITKKF